MDEDEVLLNSYHFFVFFKTQGSRRVAALRAFGTLALRNKQGLQH